MMAEKEHNITFTTGGLLYHEMLTVAEAYGRLGDWDAVRDEVLDNNLLQIRTRNAAKRIYLEASHRLKELTAQELELLLDGSPQEQLYLMWLAVTRRSLFIRDFAVELLREKYLCLDLQLTPDDYEAFFYRKEERHPELEISR